MWLFRRKLPWILAVSLVALYVTHRIVVEQVRHTIRAGRVIFTSEKDLQTESRVQVAASDPSFADLPAPVPFTQADVLDDDAKDWSNLYSHYFSGVLVFDANGDGRLDLYMCNDGQNFTRPTDERGVLQDAPRPQHNALYLNMGTDAAGVPQFTQVSELVRRNDTHVEAELLVENYLFPRATAADSQDRPGRQALVAVAADFDSDGRMDLLVGNALPGIVWSHPKTQRVMWKYVSPVGRQVKESRLRLDAMQVHLVDHTPRQSLHDERPSSRGMEPVGANTLFLNMGDRDGDGIPEWRDATRETGIEGRRYTTSLSVADVDLDGDLDVYEGNAMDPDYWPGGANALAGAANQLYLNQLAETGRLSFVERAGPMGVDQVYDQDNPVPYYHRLKRLPLLPKEYSLLSMRFEKYRPGFLELDGQPAEPGQITWATTLQDVNDDGYPDLWVANDLGFLRLYVNEQGRRFREVDHVGSGKTGNWMSFAPADYDGDLKEDMFAGNLGGGVFTHAFPVPDPMDLFDPVLEEGTGSLLFLIGSHDPRHRIVDGRDYRVALANKVRHSTVLPPDGSVPGNLRVNTGISDYKMDVDQDSLDVYEFAWGAMPLDVQNDGRPDLYYVGCLWGRGGGISSSLGTGPGRLLVNATRDASGLRFVDQTAEHRLFNIRELRYDTLDDDGYIWRPSPNQNWNKRDRVYSYDQTSWVQQGVILNEKVINRDMIQAAENGRGLAAADLNGDGFSDLVVRNMGGYDSRSSRASNLKVEQDGRLRAVPPHHPLAPVPTNYDPGDTLVLVNGHSEKGWIKVRLLDDSPGSFNRDAVGARVVVNGRALKVVRAGSGSTVSNVFEDLLFGLGDDTARKVTVEWPDAQRTRTELALPSLARGTATVSKTKGLLSWKPVGKPRHPAGPGRRVARPEPRPVVADAMGGQS